MVGSMCMYTTHAEMLTCNALRSTRQEEDVIRLASENHALKAQVNEGIDALVEAAREEEGEEGGAGGGGGAIYIYKSLFISG